MSGIDVLAAQFEEHRDRLTAVALRLLGSRAEAEDAVQEAWLRVSRAGSAEVENLGGWLTTVVARVALNQLRARRGRAPVTTRLGRPPRRGSPSPAGAAPTRSGHRCGGAAQR